MERVLYNGKVCDWEEDDESYSTDCGQWFYFEYDGPEENGFKYCPYCGRELKEIKEG